MTKLKHLFLAVCILLCAANTTAQAVWNGTADTDWYTQNESETTFSISTAEQLAGLAQLVNAGTQNFTGKTITLAADIVLNNTTGWDDRITPARWTNKSTSAVGVQDSLVLASFNSEGITQWTPIGINDSNYFRGAFDGGGHTVSGLCINSNMAYAGLFGKVGDTDTDALIKNVNIEKAVVIASSGEISEHIYAGILVGCVSSGIVSACLVSGTVAAASNTSDSFSAYAGGLIGQSSSSTIIGCSASVTSSAFSKSYYAYAGGLIGYVSSSSIVSACSASGDSSTSGFSFTFSGGLTARASSSTITDCASTGNASGISQSGTVYSGGLAGYISNDTISNSYALGNAAALVGKIVYAGALIGSVNNNAYITNCYSAGKASKPSTLNAYAGASVGRYAAGTITNCYYSSTANSGLNAVGTGTLPTGSKITAKTKTGMQTVDFVDILNTVATQHNDTAATPWIFSWQLQPEQNAGYPHHNTNLYWTAKGVRATKYEKPMENGILTISSAEELGLLAYELQNDTTKYAGKTIRLAADINLATHHSYYCNWIPMPATGINFDGNGKRIKGMNIESELSDESIIYYSIGFFSELKESVVHDVLFEAPKIKTVLLACSNTTRKCIGVVAGYAERMGIGDIVIQDPEIRIENSIDISSPMVGAVVGYGYGGGEPVLMQGITVPLNNAFIQSVDVVNATGNSSSIFVDFKGKTILRTSMGGIAGALYKSAVSSCQSNISMYFNAHQDITTYSENVPNIVIGGIAGYTSATDQFGYDYGACLFNNLYRGTINVNISDASKVNIHKGGIAGWVRNDDVVNNVALGSGWKTKYGLLENDGAYLPLDEENDTYNFSYTDLSEMSDADFAYLTDKTAPDDMETSLEGAGGLWLSAYLTMGHLNSEVEISVMDNAFATQRMLERNDDELFFNWWMLGSLAAPESAIAEGDAYADRLTVPVQSLVLTFTHAVDETNSGWEISPDGINDWTALPATANQAQHNGRYIRYKNVYKHNENMGVNKVSYSNAVQISVKSGMPTGIVQTEHAPSLQIYPNPATDGFYVQGIDNGVKTGQAPSLQISTLSGQTVWTQAVSNGEYIPVGTLPAGSYIISTNTGQTAKLLIK